LAWHVDRLLPMKRRLRRAFGGLAMLLVVVVFSVFAAVRHTPWTVPESERGPATLRTRPDGGLSLRYLGVSGYEVSDGTTVVLLDPTPTRPGPLTLLSGPLEPDEALAERECPQADVILVNHTHFDHVLDVPAIAKRTGALVVGSPSTVNLARSRGVPEEKTRVVKAGDTLVVGGFTIEVRRSRHATIAGLEEPLNGVVPLDAGRLWFWQYLLDDTLFYRLEANGTSIWFHPTSTWTDGEMGGVGAGTLIVGVLGEDQTIDKARALLRAVKPRFVLPTHYDNFLQPWEKGLALMPGLDLGRARTAFEAVDAGSSWVVLDQGERIFLPPDDSP
jgi:L-ascorbate metabolism protein UlaG (beta-lactamase superfamily)